MCCVVLVFVLSSGCGGVVGCCKARLLAMSCFGHGLCLELASECDRKSTCGWVFGSVMLGVF